MRKGRPFAIISIGLLLYVLSACAATQAFCESSGAKAAAAQGAAGDWLTLKTDYFTIEYERSVNLNSVASKLNSRGLFSSGFFSSSSSDLTPEEKVAQRADRLLKHVEEILDMYPPNFKLAIKIFKDDDALAEAYFRMMGTRPHYQAFYIFQYKTVYTSEYTISDSVLSHEMAHAVIDCYFSANPPPRIAEILATYVDAHLTD